MPPRTPEHFPEKQTPIDVSELSVDEQHAMLMDGMQQQLKRLALPTEPCPELEGVIDYELLEGLQQRLGIPNERYEYWRSEYQSVLDGKIDFDIWYAIVRREIVKCLRHLQYPAIPDQRDIKALMEALDTAITLRIQRN